MIQLAPAFWVRFRGVVDPQIPLNTTYTYAATMLASPNKVLLSATRTVTGPAQLNKRDFIEVNWTPTPGLTSIVISRNGTTFYQTNGAEQGLMDQGQYITINGGVTNT